RCVRVCQRATNRSTTFPDGNSRLWYVPHGHSLSLESSMEIFSRSGLWGAFRMAHVIVAVMWMGLLWFFNFVQTPSYSEMDPAPTNNAFDKLTWRAMWWFRWAAMATVAFGILIIAVQGGSNYAYNSDYWRSTAGVTLLIGILFGFIMLYNVWMV